MSININQHENTSQRFDNDEPSPNFIGRALSCCSPCSFDEEKVIEGSAFDIIMVDSGEGLYHNSEFLVVFGNHFQNTSNHQIILEIPKKDGGVLNQTNEDAQFVWFPVINKNRLNYHCGDEDIEGQLCSCFCCPTTNAVIPRSISDYHEMKDGDDNISSKLSPFLLPGKNPARYLLLDDERVIGVAHTNIYLWSHHDSIIVSDIDGTITQSNSIGVINTLFTENYERGCHEGVANFHSNLASEKHDNHNVDFRFLYVTSRPIRLIPKTRKFLSTLRQGEDKNKLPDGPIIGFGGNIPQVLMMELFTKKTNYFKANILWEQVVKPFQQATTRNKREVPILWAGFGNTLLDIQAYHMAGIHLQKIYLINKESQISIFHNCEEDCNEPPCPSQEQFNNPRPKKWYKNRIDLNRTFNGYSDPELIADVLQTQKGVKNQRKQC